MTQDAAAMSAPSAGSVDGSTRNGALSDCETVRQEQDARLAALDRLSEMDQEMERKHGLAGNPMIKAPRSSDSI